MDMKNIISKKYKKDLISSIHVVELEINFQFLIGKTGRMIK